MKLQTVGIPCCLLLLCLAGSSLGKLSNRLLPPSTAAAETIQLESVLTGLLAPVYVTHARDGRNRLFIVEQPGMIKVLQPEATTPTIFLDLTSKTRFGGERGLLGLAFHPQFASNRRFFVNYTRVPDGATVIAEYRVSAADPNVADPTETVLLTIPQPFANHNGGMIEFGPDGYLYIGMGDGGSANDPGNRAQNVEDLLGKMLRIDVDHPGAMLPYSSPFDNPFFGLIPGRDEIYATGLRNPWRFSFDRATGQLYAGDVGQNAREEIDLITRGGNYGWRIMEGSICNPNINNGNCTPPNGHIPPIVEYDHANGRCSVTGGYVYRGTKSTLPVGAYIYGDYCTGEILMWHNNTQSVLLDTDLLISSFGEDEAGEIYVVGHRGTLARIVNPNCPTSLSLTSQSFPSSGGIGNVTVTGSGGCAWTAVSNASWITITSGASGSGNGTVSYRVADNSNGGPRTGSLTIAGQTLTVMQSGVTTSVSAASFTGATVASEAITAAFGNNLATTTQTVTSLPLPTSLVGTSVSIRDRVGSLHMAPLFFVSPTQVNYQIPPNTALGPATVTITNGDGGTSLGMIQISAIAPGLFTANANGQGVAAGVALRLRADGSQSYESIAQFDEAQNQYFPRPLDLGPETEQVFLVLFGTGIRRHGSLSGVIAHIGNAEAQVLYAGEQKDFVGLDQVNLRLPRSLIGRGEVSVTLTVNGIMANPVQVSIK